MAVEYIKIRNWDKWQSYRKDRGQPPWIKLHREVMRNVEWVSLTDAQRGQLVAMWLLAADRDGVIPASPCVLKKLCHMDTEPDLQLFISMGFIEHGVNVTSERRQHDQPEVEVEAEAEAYKQETEKEKEKASPAKPRLDFKHSPTDYIHATTMQGHIVQVLPDFRTTNGNSVEEWAEQIREMRSCDRRSYADIADMWEYARNDGWWKKIVVTPADLRKHWLKISAQKKEPESDKTPEWIRKRDEETAKHDAKMKEIERRAFEKAGLPCP